MKSTLALILVAGLAGCGSVTTATVTADYGTTVAAIQKYYPIAVAGASLVESTGKVSPSIAAKLTAAEAVLGPEIAGLSATSAPTSIKKALDDLNGMAQLLPDSALSAQDKAGLALLVVGAEALLPASGAVTGS